MLFARSLLLAAAGPSVALVAGLALGGAASQAGADDAVLRPSHPLDRRTVAPGDATVGEGFIRFPVHSFDRRHGADDEAGTSARLLRARQQEVTVTNLQDGTIYSIDLGIGTPPQPVEVIIDTGSSELWVNPDCATAGGSSRRFCAQFPRYDPLSSTTLRDANANGFIQYGKGNVTLRYVSDTVSVGSGVAARNQIFGVATSSNDIPMGILGLGPRLTARSVNYSFVLDSLAQQGHIKSRAFSLDLRSVDNPNGAVIFGGVDTGKFIGALEKCPILNPADTPRRADRYYIYMNSLSIKSSQGVSTNIFTKAQTSPGQPVFLDSGGTLTRLPPAMFQAIGEAFPGAAFDRRSGYYVVSCAVADTAGTVDFGFGSKTIRVAFGDFIWRAGTTCVLGVLPEEREPVLGASFLRAAYVVYDQDNRNLHLAQAANCGASVVAIGSGVNAVPSSTGLCTATGTVAGASRTSSPTDGSACSNCEAEATVTVGGGPAQTSQPSAAGGRPVAAMMLLGVSLLGMIITAV